MLDAKAMIGRMRVAISAKTDVDLADALGVPYQTLNSWKKRNSIPIEALVSFCENREISLDKIVYGERKGATEKHWEAQCIALRMGWTMAIEAERLGKAKTNKIIANADYFARTALMRAIKIAEKFGGSVEDAMREEEMDLNKRLNEGGVIAQPSELFMTLHSSDKQD